MPVTTRFSASLDSAFTEETDCVTKPLEIKPRIGENGVSHNRLVVATQSTSSIQFFSSSNGSESPTDQQPYFTEENFEKPPLMKQSSSESSLPDYSRNRLLGLHVAPAKPTHLNPLQFVSAGPAKLHEKAKEQIKQVEKIKRAKTVERPIEDYSEPDWQSNLDNWKSSRRKRSEEIIERVVEVKRMSESETHAGRKKKTFNEMMQERTERGGKPSILSLYSVDEADGDDAALGPTGGAEEEEADRVGSHEDPHPLSPTRPPHQNGHTHHHPGDTEYPHPHLSLPPDTNQPELTYESLSHAPSRLQPKKSTSSSRSRSLSNIPLVGDPASAAPSFNRRRTSEVSDRLKERLAMFETPPSAPPPREETESLPPLPADPSLPLPREGTVREKRASFLKDLQQQERAPPPPKVDLVERAGDFRQTLTSFELQSRRSLEKTQSLGNLDVLGGTGRARSKSGGRGRGSVKDIWGMGGPTKSLANIALSEEPPQEDEGPPVSREKDVSPLPPEGKTQDQPTEYMDPKTPLSVRHLSSEGLHSSADCHSPGSSGGAPRSNSSDSGVESTPAEDNHQINRRKARLDSDSHSLPEVDVPLSADRGFDEVEEEPKTVPVDITGLLQPTDASKTHKSVLQWTPASEEKLIAASPSPPPALNVQWEYGSDSPLRAAAEHTEQLRKKLWSRRTEFFESPEPIFPSPSSDDETPSERIPQRKEEDVIEPVEEPEFQVAPPEVSMPSPAPPPAHVRVDDQEEEDEVLRKEREIIETIEREERERRGRPPPPPGATGTVQAVQEQFERLAAVESAAVAPAPRSSSVTPTPSAPASLHQHPRSQSYDSTHSLPLPVQGMYVNPNYSFETSSQQSLNGYAPSAPFHLDPLLPRPFRPTHQYSASFDHMEGSSPLYANAPPPPKDSYRPGRREEPVRRKPEGAPRDPNKHWLIQEAEQRRIEEGSSSLNSTFSGSSEPPHYGVLPQPDPMPSYRHVAAPSPAQRHSKGVAETKRSPIYENLPLPKDKSSPPVLSVSGRKKCSHCGQELGRGAAMIIESLRLFYHLGCFRCCVCEAPLGNGEAGADVRVRNNRLHCQNCYSNDQGLKFSKV